MWNNDPEIEWEGERGKNWLYYIKDIIAANVPSAVFLASYMRTIDFYAHFYSSVEILDLQKNIIIKEGNKLKTAIDKRAGLPFVFVVGKN